MLIAIKYRLVSNRKIPAVRYQLNLSFDELTSLDENRPTDQTPHLSHQCHNQSITRPPRLKEHKSQGGHAFIRRSFHHSGPRLYNKAPNKIKTLKNSAFKKRLKTFFYNSAFERKLDSLLSYYPSANGPPSS